LLTAEAVNFSWKSAKLPKVCSMALASSPPGSPLPFGLRLHDDVFQRRAFEFRARDHAVQLVDVSCVVLAVMVLDRLGRDVRLERVIRVGKFRQCNLTHVLFLRV
jgi:hypothetical protein